MWISGRDLHIKKTSIWDGYRLMKFIPNTGELFSGESEINCYCHDEYGFGEEMPEA